MGSGGLMKTHQYKILIIFAILSGILIQYQNCGSKGSLDSSATTAPVISGDDSSGGEMHAINPISTGGIQFLQAKTTIGTSDQNISAYGTCSVDQQGAILSWQLFDDGGHLLFSGKAPCDKGVFQVAFDGAEDLA